MDDRTAGLAALPRIDALVSAASELVQRYGRAAATDALRTAVAAARQHVADGATAPSVEQIVGDAHDALRVVRPGPPRRVINAAGVIVHTNLGRAPLAPSAVEAMVDAAGYCDVEYDLATGRRGVRGNRAEPLLTALTGAEAALVVNNGAAALVLALAALAQGREVVVSRGELVEIGGSFRLPEIMASAGARLVEVGTTNRTRAADYGAGDDVAMLLKVHPSNYRITGFAASPTVAELAAVAQRRNVPLLYDVGSGLLSPDDALPGEPDVASALGAGADLVICSGDKLLGGPQAGVIVGRADLVRRCAASPLARALRIDKLRLAALIATLEAHARGERDAIPVWNAITTHADALHRRVEALAARVGGTVEEATTMFGGGSAPGEGVTSPVVRLTTPAASAVARTLRLGAPPIIVRVADGGVVVDLRTVAEEDDALVGERLAAALP